MSSIPENSTDPLDVVNKRKLSFTRSDSFDKFQYTAIYALQYFQLAGTLLSQKSLLKVLDELQYKSRVIFEKYAVDTLLAKLKMMYAVIFYWIDAIIRCSKVNCIFEKKVASNTNADSQKEAALAKNLLLNDVTKSNESNDVKHVKCVTECETIHIRGNLMFKSLKSSDSETEMGSNPNISLKHNIGMVVIVYGSATLVYVQLMFLAAFLQTAATSPGPVYWFLVSSLGYIAYIVFKMGFAKTKSKDEPISTMKITKSTSKTTEDSIDELPVKRNGRLSRSSTRRFLYFHNKTLSKIKLL